MLCPKCQRDRVIGDKECPHCGIIFEKYVQAKQYGKKPRARPKSESLTDYVREVCLKVPTPAGKHTLLGQAILLTVITVYTWRFMFSPIVNNAAAESFLHLINLPFHEFGHILFRPFGQFISSLGGSLGQLMMPAICFYVFLFRRENTFGAAVALWWFGENFVDMAPYIYDARILEMPLLGGNTGNTAPYGFHDWEYLLTETGLLQYDQALARLSFIVGIALMVCAIFWGLVLLKKQYRLL
ncbi:MAG: zinc ribbon domain-containing protein [Gammaproteobacteria bacterium]|nr:zinc ribbon domain-containing protein [Gammaproteobacteria bacterium]MDH5802580.1 zinc ribbon domain-containing protein [Gammaproteobacteria bacterium]